MNANKRHIGVFILSVLAAFCFAAGPSVFSAAAQETVSGALTENGEPAVPASETDPRATPSDSDGHDETPHHNGYCVSYAEDLPEEDRKRFICMGDVDGNGQVDAQDARSIMRTAVRLENVSDQYLPYADLDEDGKISPSDARLALRTSVRLEDLRRHCYKTEKCVHASCDTDGQAICACDYCGVSHTIVLPATGHRYRLLSSCAPGCVTAGKEIYACEICSKQMERKLPATGHRWAEATLSSPKRCIACGAMVTGWSDVNGKTVYFRADGTKPAGDAVLYLEYRGEKTNWYLNDGALDLSARKAVVSDGRKWIVVDGRAKKVSSASDQTLFRAFLAVEEATTPSMTKQQKLRACFDYVKREYGECNPRSPHYLGADWPILYANDMFIDGRGNCFSYAAAFAFMAKAIGYEEVYCCNSTGHGWAEIDGKVYDPEWSKGNFNSTFFGIGYYDRVGVNYSVILPMIGVYDFAHVKI